MPSSEKTAPKALTVSVIVTNYNYGHYLTACLNSLHSQTSPPDEIIVVNDGSTDGSSAILAKMTDVKVIDQLNGGQAAAFNAGFAASTGEIVIFVDADDKLNPQAVEVITRLWSSEISILSYGLHMVDGQGALIGQYPMDLPDIDLRARLLGHLAIPFMPTSGNAFRRSAIDWAFPLPTERWRISADALLIRAALLAAPIRHVPQVLGAYRVHGQNNYFRSGDLGQWKANRGLRDLAQAGLDLIALTDDAGRAGPKLTRAERTKLLVAAVRCQLKAEHLKFDTSELAPFRRKLLGLSKGGRLKISLALSLFAAQFSAKLREWAGDPRQAPRALMALPTLIRGQKITSDLGEYCEPRAPFDTCLSAKSPAPQEPMHWLTGPEWVRDHGTEGAALCAAKGRLALRRVWAGPADLSLDLAPTAGSGANVAVFHNGLPVGSHDLTSRETVTFTLPEARETQTDHIELRTRDLSPGRLGRLSRMWRKSNRFQIRAISLDPTEPDPIAGVLGTTQPTNMMDLGDVVQTPQGLVLAGERLIGAGESLSLALPPLKPGYCLQMMFTEEQVAGHLNVTLNGEAVCSADLVPGGSCLIEIPSHLRVFDGPAILQFGFRPDAFLDEPVVAIQSLSWLPEPAVGRYGLPMLAQGGWAGPGTGRSLHDFLGPGWRQLRDGAAAMHGSTARLVLSQAAVSGDAVMRLSLEPLDPIAAEDPLVLMIHVNGTERAAVRLQGPATIEVDMADILSGPRHKIEVDLFAAIRREEAEDAKDHGGLRLNGLGMTPQRFPIAPTPTDAQAVPDMTLAQRLSELRVALKTGAPKRDLAILRDLLAQEIEALGPAGAQTALTASDLASLAELGSKLPYERVETTRSLTASNWLRDLALAMLAGPAFATLRDHCLTDMPELDIEFAAQLGGYIVAEPPAGTSKTALKDAQESLVERLHEARGLLATAPEGAPKTAMARAMVTGLRARRLLFSDLPLRPHIEAFGRALEAMLLRDGHDLFAPQTRSASRLRGKLKIGVILHHTQPAPETWIWRAILRKLSRNDVEITLFLTEQNAAPIAGYEACKTVGLAGQGLAATVAAIRGAQMDVMLLGASFVGHCFMAELCAHRLAPRQIALSAVSPATTGLSSVDSFVIGTSVAPKSVESDYTEAVFWAPGAGQAFDIAQPPQVSEEMRKVTRGRVGVEGDAVLLVSGAMQDKIGDDVLGVWVDILANAPEAVLVLYPFAASWQQNYDAPEFQARIAEVCSAREVDLHRVKVLPPLPNSEVRQILSVADLYLDSFPYSGATTTVEALQSGVPVVALQGKTQRGHQAAGWLKEFELTDLMATSLKSYVEIATTLAESSERRKGVRNRIDAARDKAIAQHAFSTWLAAHLLPEPVEPSGPRYVFHHMPKTAGTSLKRVFAQWFDLFEDYRAPWSYLMPAKLNLDQLGPDAMLCGHFGADTAMLRDRYPEISDPQKWRKISFIRDPLERAISIHAFEKARRRAYDQTYEAIPLGEYLRSNQGIFLTHFECDETNWKAALDSYWFIGTMEQLDASVAYLAKELGKPAPEFLPHENQTPRDEEISEDDVAVFRANNAVEFEIYGEVSKRLDELLLDRS